jgi:hypothetical protein
VKERAASAQNSIQETVTWYKIERCGIIILSRDRMTIDGDGLVIGFIDYLQIVITSNYSAIANSHILQFTTASTKSSQSAVFTSRCVVTASNVERSRTTPVPQLPPSNSNGSQALNVSNPLTHLRTNQLAPLHCTALTELNSVEWYSLRADHTENTVCNATSIVVRGLLPSNGSCFLVCLAVVA